MGIKRRVVDRLLSCNDSNGLDIPVWVGLSTVWFSGEIDILLIPFVLFILFVLIILFIQLSTLPKT
jgi:hypothetical protein